MVTFEVRQKVAAKVNWCKELVHQYTGVLITPDIFYNVRGTSAGAGGIQNGKYIIRLNPILLMENIDYMINVVLPHEFAHVAQYGVYPGIRQRPHGAKWAQFMKMFGLVPNRVHSLDVTNSKIRHVTRFSFVCNCREVGFTKRIVNKMKLGQIRWCTRCGYTFVPHGQTPQKNN